MRLIFALKYWELLQAIVCYTLVNIITAQGNITYSRSKE
jgi:hypothetical protein